MRCLLAAGLAYGDICSYRVNMGALAKPWLLIYFTLHAYCTGIFYAYTRCWLIKLQRRGRANLEERQKQRQSAE
ncbi:hypothetical protein VPH35_077883 [Triticum aestivum]|uniref:Uncharacterized protein n=1 Tax=Aegilops tauschii subsp. strangulata TaxID=200361 RepID=A0A453HYD6_AEGTS